MTWWLDVVAAKPVQSTSERVSSFPGVAVFLTLELLEDQPEVVQRGDENDGKK